MEEIVERQRERMDAYKLDALVTMSPENTTYIVGAHIPTQTTVRERQVIHILARDRDEPHVFIVNIEEPVLKEQGWIAPGCIESYNEFTQIPSILAAEKMKEWGLDGRRIGVEMGYLPAVDYARMARILPAAEFVDAGGIFDEMRMIKLGFEIDRIRDIGSKVEKVIYGAFGSVRAGMTEADLFNRLLNGFNALVGGKLTMPVVASGKRSCLLNGAATDKVLEPGDIVRVDMIGTKNNYYVDCCRTAVVGNPEERHVKAYRRLVEAHDEAIARIAPGVDTKSVYDEYAARFRSWGMEPISFIGHGLGLTLHEEPYINTYKNTILRENMVLCVEPIYVVDGDCGYQLENEVLVTAGGRELLTGTQFPYDEMPVIPV